MSLGNRAIVSLVIAAASVAAGAAHAATPRYDALPESAMSQSPGLDSKPDQIAASEKVAGLFLALPPARYNNHSPKGSRYISVFSSEQQAKQYSSDGSVRHAFATQAGVGSAPAAASACMTVADHWHMKQGPQAWPMSFSTHASIHGVDRGSPAAKQHPNVGVRALHLEQLELDSSGGASLKTTDAWVDPTSLGARLIGEDTMPLQQVAAGPGGVRVFAARDNDSAAVHFVVYSPPANERVRNVVGRHMMVMRGPRTTSSNCGHARLTLRTAPGTGERGTVSIELPLSTEEVEAPARKVRVIRALLGSSDREQPPIKEVRVRTLQVHTSISQAAGDKQPIPSVTFGWQGRERRMQTP